MIKSATLCRRHVARIATAVSMAFAVPATLVAQGAITMQGFGYPGGQLSTRALGAGGALADFDANSPLNPAALVVANRASVYAQYDPEFRSVRGVTGNSSGVTARFPVLAVSGRYGRATFGFSFSNLLDRTWVNTYTDSESVGGRVVQSRVTAQSAGGISDVRAAAAWTFSDKVHVGAGVHLFPGENRTLLGRDFADSLQIGSFTQANTYNFSGTALSVGILAIPLSHLNVAVAARFGGTLRMRLADTAQVGAASVPGRVSVSAAYDGYAGSLIAVRYAREQWSALRGLGSAGLSVTDAADLSGGVEFAGPKLSGLASAVRLGFRTRDLPFGVGAARASESALTAGIGLPFGSGRGAGDLTVARAHRVSGGASETGWILSFGFSIKP